MTRRVGTSLGAVALLALVALGCDSGSSRVATPSSGPTTQPLQLTHQGGGVVAAAEAEPGCMDWIQRCGDSRWGRYTVEANTLPRAYDLHSNSTLLPSILLTGEAQVATSGQHQSVSYSINSRAVWDDFHPITSTDFKYTWKQVVTSTNVPDKSGYDQILSVDDSDPHTAIVTFAKPFVDWKALFGGRYGILPSHLLDGKDRHALMRDGYSFSGGPWKLDRWSRGRELVMVPNLNYWGKKPELDSLTFMLIADPTLEQQAFSAGQVSVAYPEPQLSQIALKNQPGVMDVSSGGAVEGIWFNVAKVPLASLPVRQALAYATDRDAIVQQELAPVQPGIKTAQSFYPPSTKVDGKAFARYSFNLSMVSQLMTKAGWTKGGDGIWAKAATSATVEIKTTDGNPRRLATAQLLQRQWHAAGFEAAIVTEPAATLLTQDLPAGNFEVALYARAPGDTSAGQCRLWCSKATPTLLNGLSGSNVDRVRDSTLDKTWTDAETSQSSETRQQEALQGQERVAELVPAIPLAALPDVFLVRSNVLGAEGGSFQRNPVYGPFLYANEWYLQRKRTAGPR